MKITGPVANGSHLCQNHVMKPINALISSLAMILSACAPANAPPPDEAGPATPEPASLTIYSARHYDSDALMYAAFEAETGIRIKVREGKAGQLLETLKAEGKNSSADLIIAADAGSLWRFQQAGLTQPVSAEALETLIPAKFREADGHWFGVSKRLRGIAYDTSKWTAADVSSWQSLARQDSKGEICVRSSSNIYNLSLLAEMIVRLGEDAAAGWAEAVRQNMARRPQGGDTDQIRAIAAGQCSLAIVNHYYLERLLNSASQTDRDTALHVAFSVPDFGDAEGAHVNVTAAAIAQTSQNTEAALSFILFLMSPQGQTYLTMETRELAMLEGSALPDSLIDGAELIVSDIPLSAYGENQARAQRLYDLAGWN